MKRKRIGIVVNDMLEGGAQRTALNLASGLAAAGHRVDLLLFSAKGNHLPLIPNSLRVFTLNTRIWRSHRRQLRRIPPSVEVRHLGPRWTGRTISYFRVLAALRLQGRQTNHLRPMLAHAALGIAEYIRLETPHALLASLLSAEVSAVLGRNLAGGGTKVAVWSHGFVHSISTQTPDIQLRMRDFVNRESDMIVCIARGEVEEFLRHTAVPRQKIAMIHNPVVTPDLPALAAQRPRHPWLLNDPRKVVVAAGRLDQVKDFPTLLRAFARLADKNMCLIVLGEGGQRLALENLASELGIAGRVDFPGWIANPFALMARARLFVLSSRYEGLSRGAGLRLPGGEHRLPFWTARDFRKRKMGRAGAGGRCRRACRRHGRRAVAESRPRRPATPGTIFLGGTGGCGIRKGFISALGQGRGMTVCSVKMSVAGVEVALNPYQAVDIAPDCVLYWNLIRAEVKHETEWSTT